MQPSSHARAGALVMFTFWLACRQTYAAFVTYTDEAAWKAATPVVTTIQFSEIPAYSGVTDQYAALGVTFATGADYTAFIPSLWPSDGFGLHGGWSSQGFVLPIIMEFETPITSLAIRYPSVTKFLLYSNGVQIGETNQFLGFNIWSFAGVVSDTPFDKLVVTSTVGANSMDTLFFGAPVPGPAGLVAFALGGIVAAARSNRRRRSDSQCATPDPAASDAQSIGAGDGLERSHPVPPVLTGGE